MKYSFMMILTLLCLFLICEFFGLYVSYSYSQRALPYGIEPPEMSPQEAIVYIVFAIVVVTVLFIMLHKLKLKLFLKLWFILAFILCIAVSLSVFIPSWIALLVSALIVLLKMREPDLYLHNIGEILIYGGAVAVFVPLLSLVSVIVILIAISFYDFVSVFITKHMITLAKTQREEGIFAGLVIRFKDEFAILGGGDVAFPMLFASVVMRELSVIPAIFIVYGATLGLMLLIILGKRKKYYPALPFITLGSFLGFLLGYAL